MDREKILQDEFTRGYFLEALATSKDEMGTPYIGYLDMYSFSAQTFREMAAECKRFQQEAGADLAVCRQRKVFEEQQGRLFWRHRAGLGGGFDSIPALGEEGKRLAALADSFGRYAIGYDDKKCELLGAAFAPSPAKQTPRPRAPGRKAKTRTR